MSKVANMLEDETFMDQLLNHAESSQEDDDDELASGAVAGAK